MRCTPAADFSGFIPNEFRFHLNSSRIHFDSIIIAYFIPTLNGRILPKLAWS